ncbi:hypothetical protein NAT51_19295 [Flavobacterium amniphilum]|uniref:hypothetical protein n=1 Tax=Flavobacterium amniphilum TaxID=1834035 RepID=UPI00202A5A81|nr:hypothetical protein [Flavobacterium amniphilum]MCL9807677.1 hypothetical protein [Flavobacterium amniphilum]
MKKIIAVVMVLVGLNVNAQTTTDIQKQNARATGYAVIAAKNPGIDFSVYVIPWDGVNTLEYNAQNQINASWHAQCAIKGGYFNQPFNGTDNLTMYSSVLTSQEQFDIYKSTGTQWWIVCSTLPAYSPAVNGTQMIKATVSDYSPVLSLKRNTTNGGYIQGIQSQQLDGTNNWFFGNYNADRWMVSKGDHQGSKLIVKDNGNVGIGVYEPATRLEVYNTAGQGHLTLVGNDNGAQDLSRISLDYKIQGAEHIVGRISSFYQTSTNNGSGGLRFFTRNQGSLNEVMRMDSNNNVGIGVTSPKSKLSIKGVGDYNIGVSIQSPNANQALDIMPGFKLTGSPTGQRDDTTMSFRSSGDNMGNIAFATGNDERMRIGGNGNVGIGTTNPQYRLDVVGKSSFTDNMKVDAKIEAKEVKITLTPTADFVFEEDYNLPKLEEVEKHIKEKKHLPEIASAKEMEKEGVNVGEFQIKLLQKIEELTLYTIEQNKKIMEMQKEIAALKKISK